VYDIYIESAAERDLKRFLLRIPPLIKHIRSLQKIQDRRVPQIVGPEVIGGSGG